MHYLNPPTMALLSTRNLCRIGSSPRICVVGSGPAGFYFAQHLLKSVNATVDMYEKLPVPFGLVRYGVAPDHPEVKNVINTFTKTASSPNFRFVGNVSLGEDVSLAELQSAYNAVVLSYGCSADAELGIEGERLGNVVSARRFVGWYNGLPEDADLSVDLDCKEAVVLGQGNVAIDVARILLSPVDVLKKTDITSYSLEALSRSRIEKVHLVARRGPLQAAFTIKEFREMTKLPNVRINFKENAFEDIHTLVPNLMRPRKRLTELMVKTAAEEQTGDRSLDIKFLLKPNRIYGSGSVEGVEFAVNTIDHKKGTTRVTDRIETIPCGLVLRSIGYRGTCPDPKIPFCWKNHVVLPSSGIYSSGWISTGPVGVILSTMNNAFDTADTVVQHLNSTLDLSTKEGFPFIKEILRKKGIQTVSFEGWKRIDEEEIRRGQEMGKPREKIVDINEMLSIGGE